VVDDLPNWLVAARAAEAKKAKDLLILDLREITSFTEFFVICTAANKRQAQSIADEIGMQLKRMGELPVSAEGYDTAEWILLDYGDFLVHIFSEAARSYYELERLWRGAKIVGLAKAAQEFSSGREAGEAVTPHNL
jgi:ribosome-associated protein